MRSKVFGDVHLSPAWFSQALGLEEPHPFQNDLDEIVRFGIKKNAGLLEHFGDLPLVAGGEPSYPILQYDRRLIIASAFGAAEPTWDAATASFWGDKRFGPWREIKDADQVRRLAVPDWESVPLVKQMLGKWDEAKSRGTYPVSESSEWMEFDWTNPYTGRKYQFSDFTSFVDLGHFLCGSTEFFTVLGGEKELARAMLEKCFELSTSFSDWRRKTYGRPLEAWSLLGGDNSCNLSPQMYQEYAMTHDAMIVERYGDLPCCLHSCGPSAHLYDVWGTYPNRDNIVLMQTRGIAGQLRRLRTALPETFLQITLHQPQFDFEHESADAIEAIVNHYGEESDYHNLELVVEVNLAGDQTDRNIRTFYQAIDRINERL